MLAVTHLKISVGLVFVTFAMAEAGIIKLFVTVIILYISKFEYWSLSVTSILVYFFG
jgi:hypothetical protein